MKIVQLEIPVASLCRALKADCRKISLMLLAVLSRPEVFRPHMTGFIKIKGPLARERLLFFATALKVLLMQSLSVCSDRLPCLIMFLLR